ADRHTRREAPSRRLRDHSRCGLRKEGYDLLPADGRKPRQEVVDRLAALEIIDERLNGNAGSREHRCSAQDIRRRRHDGRLPGRSGAAAVAATSEAVAVTTGTSDRRDFGPRLAPD